MNEGRTSRTSRTMRRSMLAIGTLLLPLGGVVAENLRVVQTNSRDNVIHLIDPETQSIVGEIKGIPVNHGVAAAPDGRHLYFTSEAKHTLDVVDTATLEIVEEIPLSARPHNISISKDGRFVYIGIMEEPGGIDIVDTTTLEKARRIETRSRVHNTYVTPDGRYLVAGTFGGDRNLNVFDIETEKLVWSLFDKRSEEDLEGVRPIAFETKPDGSTDRMFVQISDLHGFTVVDFDERREVDRIMLPDVPEEERDPGPFTRAPAHGIGVAPNGETLWVASRMNGHVYAYSLPELELLGGVQVGSHPDWLTFTPDSEFVYVANGHSHDVSIIAVDSLKEVRRLDVGQAPKRNIVAVLP